MCAVMVGTELDASLLSLRTTPTTFPYMNDLTSVSAPTYSTNVIGISARIVLNASISGCHFAVEFALNCDVFIISTQVFLGFPVPISKRSDGSQHSKLPLHVSHVALRTSIW